MTKKRAKEKSEMKFDKGATMVVNTQRMYASIRETIALQKQNRSMKVALRKCAEIIAKELV